MSCFILWRNEKYIECKQGRGTALFTKEQAEHLASIARNRDGTTYYVIDLKVYEAIAQVCVMKGLPGGDPCWIAKKIAGYVNYLHK